MVIWMGVSKQMQGMDIKYNGHTWCKWKWPTLKTFLVWSFEVLNVWAISGAKMSLVMCFCDLVFIIKSTKVTTRPKFLLSVKLSRLFLAQFLVRFVVPPLHVCKLVMLHILCGSFVLRYVKSNHPPQDMWASYL
jgi:hypothetical protein